MIGNSTVLYSRQHSYQVVKCSQSIILHSCLLFLFHLHIASTCNLSFSLGWYLPYMLVLWVTSLHCSACVTSGPVTDGKLAAAVHYGQLSLIALIDGGYIALNKLKFSAGYLRPLNVHVILVDIA